MTEQLADLFAAEQSPVIEWRGLTVYAVSPTVVQLTVTITDCKKASLKIWNIWRGGLNVIQAWLGNSGLVVEPADGGQLLVRCSDGAGQVDFNSLIIRLKPSRTQCA